MMNINSKTIMIGLVQPISPLCVITILMLNILITNNNKPKKSNFDVFFLSALISGTSLISISTIPVTMMDTMKIHCHPIYAARKPANTDESPVPPYEPIDHILNAL